MSLRCLTCFPFSNCENTSLDTVVWSTQQNVQKSEAMFIKIQSLQSSSQAFWWKYCTRNVWGEPKGVTISHSFPFPSMGKSGDEWSLARGWAGGSVLPYVQGLPHPGNIILPCLYAERSKVRKPQVSVPTQEGRWQLSHGGGNGMERRKLGQLRDYRCSYTLLLSGREEVK